MAIPSIHHGDFQIIGRLIVDEIDGLREIKSIVGDGENRVFYVTHTLGVKTVSVSVFADNDGSQVLVRCVIQNVGNICITFVDPPKENETFTVVIHK